MGLMSTTGSEWSHLLNTARQSLAKSGTLEPQVPAPIWQGSQNSNQFRVLSLGAGVQSTALLLLAAEGRIAPFDVAVFADTGWEPNEVYEHLDQIIARVAKPAGIEVVRVSNGDLKQESLSVNYTTVLPLFIRNPDNSAGILSRQCTQNYKLLPIYRYVRRMLGAVETFFRCSACDGDGKRIPPGVVGHAEKTAGECSVCRGIGTRRRIGPAPAHVKPVQMAIGFSADEIQRVAPSRRRYVTHEYPLLDLNWTREDTLGYLRDRGFAETPRSACIGCPYHSDAEWQRLRDTSPDEWTQALAFDAAIRSAPGSSSLRGQFYLHRKLLPLADAVKVTSTESGSKIERPGCSPFGCRSEAGIDIAGENNLLDHDEFAEDLVSTSPA